MWMRIYTYDLANAVNGENSWINIWLSHAAHFGAYVFFCRSKGLIERHSRCTLQAICNCAKGHCIVDDPMETSSFIIPARLYNAWEILTVITVASQGFLPRPTGFRDSANYGSGMDLQCLIYYSSWAGLKAPPENYWRIKRTGWWHWYTRFRYSLK